MLEVDGHEWLTWQHRVTYRKRVKREPPYRRKEGGELARGGLHRIPYGLSEMAHDSMSDLTPALVGV